MTHDATVERVARAIQAELIAGRYVSAEYEGMHENADAALRAAARAALSALPPRDELLREALSALQPFAAQTRASGPTEERNIRRARAAADKIRAALGGE